MFGIFTYVKVAYLRLSGSFFSKGCVDVLPGTCAVEGLAPRLSSLMVMGPSSLLVLGCKGVGQEFPGEGSVHVNSIDSSSSASNRFWSRSYGAWCLANDCTLLIIGEQCLGIQS